MTATDSMSKVKNVQMNAVKNINIGNKMKDLSIRLTCNYIKLNKLYQTVFEWTNTTTAIFHSHGT